MFPAMRSLQYVLLLSLICVAHCSPGPNGDENARGRNRRAIITLRSLYTRVRRQAKRITSLQSSLNSYGNLMSSYKIQMDAYQSQMKTYKTEMNTYKSQMNSYRNRMDSYKNQLDAYKTEMNTFRNRMDSYKNQLDAYKTRQDAMDTQLQALQNKGDAASASVAFTARIPHRHDNDRHGLTLGHHQTVIFGEAVTNIGNAYNSNTGVFSAPVPGTYVFFLHTMNPNLLGDLRLVIVRNGAPLALVYAEGRTDVNDQASTEVTTHLAAGDQVWVRQDAGGGVRASWYSVFSGFLLRAG